MKSAREFKFKKKPTEKQMELIREIEEYCNVSFDGETRDEASDFIDEWIMELQDRKADERNFFRDN